MEAPDHVPLHSDWRREFNLASSRKPPHVGCPMIRNPDRDFSAGKLPREEQEKLWKLLERSDVADLLEPGVCERFGRVIGRAAFHPAHSGWYSGWTNSKR